MNATLRRRSATAAALLALPLALAACGSSSGSSATSAPAAASPSASAMTSETPMEQAMGPADQVFGAGCAAVPADGAGSFDGMAADPVATAASNNPALSTLVTAVKAAGLVDSLNSAEGITVFAPTNDAFAAVPKKTLDAAMADPKGLLTTVLTYHVVAGQLSPDELAGEHTTLQGSTLEVTGSGEDFTVNGSAKVVCGNVPTANATVYIVDGVLLPKS